MPARDGAPSLDAVLAAKEMVLVCGSGGVGKTTTAAAMAATAATHLGGRVLVLTVDPARRLADALGIGALGNTATRVPDAAFAAAGVEPRGELWAAMLDTKAGWDELIRRHAPDAKVRDAVLANPLYVNITSRFVHSHDYLAMEQLHELHASGRYDLIVVDTPPSRSALDVLDAPGRMKEFFESRLLRWLTVPYRSRLFTAASKPFYSVADRILGSRFLQDIAEFFILFQAMEKRFVAHATAVERLLGDHRTTFVVVSTLEAAPAHEAAYLARALGQRDFHLGAIIANRVLPTEFMAKGAANSAKRLHAASGGPLADRIAVEIDAPVDVVSSTLDAAASRFHDIALVATREAERRAELEGLAALLLTAPTLDRDINDVADLLALGEHLRGERR
jgi:anion-transporting  ArsA/GET3 family ATPase